MAHLTANGLPVGQARIHLPRLGVWQAELFLPGADEFPGGGAVELRLGGALRLNGSVRIGGTHQGAVHLRVVGGGGGFPAELPARAYRKASVRVLLQDLLREAGEELSPASDAGLLGQELEHWVRVRGTAASGLASLVAALGASWRVLTDGRTWVGSESWPATAPEHELLQDVPSRDLLRVRLEEPTLLPGRTFRGRRVSHVTHIIEPERLEAEVWLE